MLAAAIFQVAFFFAYRRKINQTPNQKIDPDFQPRTAVILCLRGPDPSIERCLRSLAVQSYRNFELHLVADDSKDPALAIAEDLIANDLLQSGQPSADNRTQVAIEHQFHILSEPLPTCSLKCSALIHAVSKLPDTVSVVALIDADAVVSPNWLETLINPLADPSVGASTANRWFTVPVTQKIGSAMRAVWNAAAVVQMSLYTIPWGGSLAIKRTVIDEADLLERWSRSFCEDTLLTQVLHKRGLSVARPVELIVVNDETITCFNAYRWIRRQLLTVRLHHPSWRWVFLHGLSVGLPLFCAELMFYAFYFNATQAALILMASTILFEILSFALLVGIQNVHRTLSQRAGGQKSPENNSLFWYAIALPLTQMIHFSAALSAALAKKVSWRQIDYRIGKSKVELIEYEPFVPQTISEKVELNAID